MIKKIINFIFTTYIYQRLFLNKRYNLFNYKIDLSIFDSINYNGHSILYNEIDAYGKKYNVREFLNINYLPWQVLMYLHRFYWLSNLKALGTKEASEKAFYLVDIWMSKFFEINLDTWEDSILSERIFQLIICYEFIIKNKDDIAKHKLLQTINKQVAYLFNIYKLHKIGVYKSSDKLKLAKALIAVSLSKNGNKKDLEIFIKKLLLLVEEDIKENIFHDGGHSSRSPSLALSYLEDLLQIYYMVRPNQEYNISNLRSTIDRISLFIRSIRNPNGTLAVFNGGVESTKSKIDYLLSLSNIYTQSSMVLRNSGYTKISTHNIYFIFDVGKMVKDSNSLLSFELSINQKKIVTNLGSNLSSYRSGRTGLENLGRLSNSCLILKMNGKVLSFEMNESNLKIERRSEDSWDIIKFIYYGLKDLGITYYRTIYLSKKDYTCILGEDMLSFQNDNIKSSCEAFLRFNFSPEVKSIEFFKKSKVVLFSVDDNQYILSSNDNKILLSKSIYSAVEEELLSCYTADIAFNISSKIVKNEWSISTEEDMQKISNQNREKIRVLDVVDMQNSFLKQDGSLSIKEAEFLIEKTNMFFKNIPENYFDAILIKQDTHFEKEYQLSSEYKEFPLHCQYGSKDWELAINPLLIQGESKLYKMYKNKFDMWDKELLNLNDIGFDYKNYSGYKNLYKVISYYDDTIAYNSVDELLLSYNIQKVDVYIIGVASDYCVKYAIDGYLKRGYNVYIIQDLTKGINKEIIEVLQSDYIENPNLLNIRVISSESIC